MNERQSRLNWQDPTFHIIQRTSDNNYLIEDSEDEIWKLESIENKAHEINSIRGRIMAQKRKYSAF